MHPRQPQSAEATASDMQLHSSGRRQYRVKTLLAILLAAGIFTDLAAPACVSSISRNQVSSSEGPVVLERPNGAPRCVTQRGDRILSEYFSYTPPYLYSTQRWSGESSLLAVDQQAASNALDKVSRRQHFFHTNPQRGVSVGLSSCSPTAPLAGWASHTRVGHHQAAGRCYYRPRTERKHAHPLGCTALCYMSPQAGTVGQRSAG